jgi:hypothetical protein
MSASWGESDGAAALVFAMNERIRRKHVSIVCAKNILGSTRGRTFTTLRRVEL